MASVIAIEPKETLLQVLRERLGLTGTKESCGEGECGTCSVLLDREVVNSCLVLAVDVDGHAVTTIEGLARGDQLTRVQSLLLERLPAAGRAGDLACGANFATWVPARIAFEKPSNTF